MVAIKGQTKFRYFVGKKEAKLSASEIPGVEEGKGDGDLRCRSLVTVCQSKYAQQECLPKSQTINQSKVQSGQHTVYHVLWEKQTGECVKLTARRGQHMCPSEPRGT